MFRHGVIVEEHQALHFAVAARIVDQLPRLQILIPEIQHGMFVERRFDRPESLVVQRFGQVDAANFRAQRRPARDDFDVRHCLHGKLSPYMQCGNG